MRILLVNQYAGGPSLGMEYRPHWMAREWQALGHDVLVVAADWTHLRRQQLPRRRGHLHVEGVDFYALPVLRHGANGPKRFANILGFAAVLNAEVTRLAAWHPDAVIASSTHPLDVRACARLADASGARLVHEIHDLWPLTPRLLANMSAKHPMIRLMQHEEDFACRRSDAVISILPATRGYLIEHGMDAAKWTHIPNGVPEGPELNLPVVPPPESGPFRVGYFGAHGEANDLATLIAAARLLELEGGGVEVHLWGDGPARESLADQAADLASVTLHGAVPPDAARQEMRAMDALYVGLVDSPLFDHGVSPNKMFEYMCAGRPIVQAIRTPSSPAVEAGAAVICDPGQPESVARAVRRLRTLTSSERVEMGARGRAYVRESATYPVLAKRLVDCLV